MPSLMEYLSIFRGPDLAPARVRPEEQGAPSGRSSRSVVADGAVPGRTHLEVAGQAPAHGQRLLDLLDHADLLHLPVAGGAVHAGGDVPHVGKLDVVRDLVDPVPRNRLATFPEPATLRSPARDLARPPRPARWSGTPCRTKPGESRQLGPRSAEKWQYMQSIWNCPSVARVDVVREGHGLALGRPGPRATVASWARTEEMNARVTKATATTASARIHCFLITG
jgi:hypothetical protein